MEWLSLFMVAVFSLLTCHLSYSEEWRRGPRWLYYGVGIAICILATGIWYAVIRHIDNRERIYVYNLLWDAIACVSFYFAPILFLGVKLDRWSMFGLLLIVAGLTIIKMRTE